jgi:8-hydroxy-5-deazaflavin:NADPH oxidoreductase
MWAYGCLYNQLRSVSEEHHMASITIFGTGNMGSAIAAAFAAGGNSVEHIDTATAAAAVTGEIVVLAVPYAAVEGIIAEHGAAFAGKVLVDITNPVDLETFDGLVVPADSSAAAVIAAAVPGARVVKAFNTNFAATLAGGTVGGLPSTVLVAGDDAEAKQVLTGALTAGGRLTVLDAGSLKRARELEALGFLQISLAATEQIPWTGGFAIVR